MFNGSSHRLRSGAIVMELGNGSSGEPEVVLLRLRRLVLFEFEPSGSRSTTRAGTEVRSGQSETSRLTGDYQGNSVIVLVRLVVVLDAPVDLLIHVS